MEALNAAKPVYESKKLNLADKDSHASASISRPGGILTLTFYAGFYGKIYDGKTGFSVNDEKQEAYVDYGSSLEDRTLTVIHEAIHAISPDFSDGFIGRIIKGKDKDLSKKDGSKAINEYVKKHCEKRDANQPGNTAAIQWFRAPYGYINCCIPKWGDCAGDPDTQ